MAAMGLQKILRENLIRRGIKANEINGGERYAGIQSDQGLL